MRAPARRLRAAHGRRPGRGRRDARGGGPAPPAAGDGLGRVAPTPIMHWLRELGGPIGGFHQSLVLQAPAGARPRPARARSCRRCSTATTCCARACAATTAGRSRCRRRAACAPRTSSPWRDVATARRCAPRRRADRGGRRAAGPRRRAAWSQAVWLDAGPARPGACSCSSTTSWSTASRCASCWPTSPAPGRRSTPAARRSSTVGTSFRRWAQRLAAGRAPRRPRRRARAAGERPRRAGPALGARALRPGARPRRQRPTLTVTLPAALTATLLTTAARAVRRDVNDVLLTALAVAVGRWRAERGPCGADPARVARRPRGPRPRGRLRRRRPLPHGRLVHDAVPGPRSTRRDRPGRSPRAAAPTPGARSSASRSSCAPCPTAAWATGCCATSTRRRARARRSHRRRSSLFNYLGRFAVAGRHAVDGRARRAAARRRRDPRDADGPRARRRRRVRDGAAGRG